MAEETSTARNDALPMIVDAYNAGTSDIARMAARNEYIARRMYIIDVEYTEFETALTRERQEFGYGSALAAQGLSTAGAVFTQNRVVAGPVEVARKNVKAARGRMRGILVNAGNANCATKTSVQVAMETSRAAARLIGAKAEEVLPASTGVIGVELDAKLILEALPKLVEGLSPGRFEDAARAIMTTDLAMKTARSCPERIMPARKPPSA